jgi:uncharacterized protein YegL
MSEKKAMLRNSDFANNPSARLPVCLCLDTSGSMRKDSTSDPIGELNAGIKAFYDIISNNIKARVSAEICIVTFGGKAQMIEDFATIEERPDVPELGADGLTPMGEGVNLALDLLEERKSKYKDEGVDYFQPWLVLITDGAPEGGSEPELQRAIDRITKMVNKNKLTIFPIGVSNADMDVLQRFSPNRRPLKLQESKFEEFFVWLGKSVERTSMSIPGEKVPLDTDGIKDWAEL